jgi:hypothetical protein
MPNYALKFSVSEVARVFNEDRDVVKKWAYKFADYVSQKGNPPTGTPREICLDDIRVFAYVYTLWEDEPDLRTSGTGSTQVIRTVKNLTILPGS